MKFYFVPNRLFMAILIVLVLAVLVVPAFAQDTSFATNTPALEEPVPTVVAPDPVVTPVPDPAPDVQQPINPDQAGEMLLSTILGIIAAGAGGSALTAFFVGLLKHVSKLDNISAPSLNFFVGGVLTVVYWIVSHFGYASQFKAASDFILTSGPALITFLATMWGASKIHKGAVAEKIAVFGYKRPDKDEKTTIIIGSPRPDSFSAEAARAFVHGIETSKQN